MAGRHRTGLRWRSSVPCWRDLHSSEVLQRVVIRANEVNCFVNYSKAAYCDGGCVPVGMCGAPGVPFWLKSNTFHVVLMEWPDVFHFFLYIIPSSRFLIIYRFYRTGQEYLTSLRRNLNTSFVMFLSGIRPNFRAFPFNKVGFGDQERLINL